MNGSRSWIASNRTCRLLRRPWEYILTLLSKGREKPGEKAVGFDRSIMLLGCKRCVYQQ
jgi:hypothetical protein